MKVFFIVFLIFGVGSAVVSYPILLLFGFADALKVSLTVGLASDLCMCMLFAFYEKRVRFSVSLHHPEIARKTLIDMGFAD